MTQKVLLIEDEPAIADSVTYALETEGYDALWCSTGGEGLQRIASGDIDMVVLDVGLPDTNGFELCKEIRKSSQVPIIFLTARRDEIDRIVGLEIGGDDYVVKPFSPRELTARVKAIFRRTSARGGEAPGEPAAPESFPFEVDEERFSITYFGEKLDLLRYEYRILRILASRPGWIYSRAKLMEMAWDEPEASFERTVDAHIKNVRAKLRAVRPDVEAIVTHRGLGYSLREEW